MPPDALQNLWQRWDNDPPVFHADEVQPLFGPILDRLVSMGLVRETTPSECAPCWDCGDGFVGRITCVRQPSTGERRAYIHCPECGVKEVAFEHLRRWVVADEDALHALAVAAGLRSGFTESVANHLWRIGYGVFGRRRREVYFARNVHDGNRDDVIAVLVKHAKALLLVPTPASAEHWQCELPNVVVALEDAFACNDGQITFDPSIIEDRYAELDALPRGRVSTKRAVRAAKIEKLTAVLADHLRSARDHAFTRKVQTGLPELLPRPTQQQLARMLGISATDVSRCLRDKSARELRIYWQTANDLDQVMKWPGRKAVSA
jgi:hypothetical protein